MLSDLMLEIKAESLTALDAQHRPAPDRTRLYWGQRPPVWPCPDAGELVLYSPRGFDTTDRWGSPGWAQGGAGRRCDAVTVRLVRCHPQVDASGSPPTDLSVETAALGLHADLRALWYGLITKACSGFTHAANEGVVVADWTPMPPQGGRAAVEIHLIVQAVP